MAGILNRPPVEGRGAVRIRSLVIVVWAVALLAGAGCSTDQAKEGAMPTRDINSVMNDHAERLLALPEVVMVAVGELPDHTPCIQVYIKYDDDELRRKIGAKIEGHPVDLIISDDIRPLR